MKKAIAGVLVNLLFLLALSVPVYAENTMSSADNHYRSMSVDKKENWPWFGVIGLVGLFGLMGRGRNGSPHK